MEYAKVTALTHSSGERFPVWGGLAHAVCRLDASTNTIALSNTDALKLGLRPGQLVAYWREAEGLHLGPYIGIMTKKRPGNKSGFAGLAGRRENFTTLTKIARSMGSVAFVFACEDIDFKRLRVTGYYRSGTGKWVAREYPLPNVIYNRIPDRASEVSPLVKMTKRRVEQLAHNHRVSLFNPHFLNKWDLHRLLSREVKIQHYLPDTVVYRRAEDLRLMLKKHRMVYLKPKDNFAGKGIMRVQHKSGKFILSFKDGGVYRHSPQSDFSSLVRSFAAKREPGVYLVQQGLKLAKYKGCMFDARIIVQKNEHGQWDLTGAGVRVAARGGITTHVPNGGYIAPIASVLKEVFHEDCETRGGIYSMIKDLALSVAPAIERQYRRMFGELSMDIGITEDGRCYFFEANAKPMKFDEPIIRRKSLRRLVEYSRFLAGYQVDSYASN